MQVMVRRRVALLVALGGVVAAGVAWLVLAIATGLIFHLMPAGPPLLGGILLRRGHHRSTMAVVTVMSAGILVSLAVALALARLDQPLDDPPWTIAVTGIGVAVASAISRWPFRDSPPPGTAGGIYEAGDQRR